MKQFFTVILALIVALGAIFGVYYYIHSYSKHYNVDDTVLTTAVPKDVSTTEKQEVLLASLDDADFKLYLDGTSVKLVHDGQTNEFSDWSSSIDLEPPQMYYADFDSDGENELLIRAVNGIDNRGKNYYYALYILSPHKQEDGSYEYDVVAADESTWTYQFGTYVQCEIRNLEKDNSRIQIAMDLLGSTISYDKKTGFANDAAYVGYARCLYDTKMNYYTLTNWQKGYGIYQIEENNAIGLNFPLYLQYENTETMQLVGTVHIGLTLKGKDYSITKKSIYFTPDSKYKVSDPRVVSKSDWNYDVANMSAPGSSTDKIINWIDGTFTLKDKTQREEQYFASITSEIKSVDNINFSNKAVTLTAKEGYSFAKSYANSNGFSVVINSGTEQEYSIAKDAKIVTDDSTGIQSLVIELDKSYPRDSIKTITVKYGS